MQPLTRFDVHRAAVPAPTERVPVDKSVSLRRDVQEVVATTEAAQDLEVLDRLLRDIRDLANADEAI